MSRTYKNEVNVPVAYISNHSNKEQKTLSVTIEDDYESLVQRGKVFTIPIPYESVPNNGVVYILHRGGATKELHSIANILCVGKWRFESFSGATITSDGTEVFGFPRKSSSTEVLETRFYKDAVISDEGTRRMCFCFGAGTNPSQASSTQYSDKLESIFSPNQEVIIRLTNLSGSASYLSILLNVHERRLQN